MVPISLVVAVLLVLVVSSYRQTIKAYPSGGGSYIVTRENLGRYPSLVAAAALMIDYVLTVAVSISAGVAAVVSLPALRGLASHRVVLCLVAIAVITLANLRGIKESGRLFAVPTYTYIALMARPWSCTACTEATSATSIPSPSIRRPTRGPAGGGTLGMFLLLKGFSSGAIALTGVEAISNGVPAFRPPESKNAATTLTLDGHDPRRPVRRRLAAGQPPPPLPEQERDRHLRARPGGVRNGTDLRPAPDRHRRHLDPGRQHRLCRLSPGGLHPGPGRLRPRQLARRGDRLVFSRGIVGLAVVAAVLVVVFGGKTDALGPAVRRRRLHRLHAQPGGDGAPSSTAPGARMAVAGRLINAVGALATLVVLRDHRRHQVHRAGHGSPSW